MPYASKAQQRKLHSLLEQRKIKPSVVKEYDDSTNFRTLPEKMPRGQKPKRKKI